MDNLDDRAGVIIVDDNIALCKSLEHWIPLNPELRCLGHAPDGRAAARLISETHPRIVLLDIDIPGTDVWALLRWIVAEHPSSRVVMLSGMLTPGLVARSLDSGAAGYIVKDDDPPTIARLITRVVAGEVALSEMAQTALLKAPKRADPAG